MTDKKHVHHYHLWWDETTWGDVNDGAVCDCGDELTFAEVETRINALEEFKVKYPYFIQPYDDIQLMPEIVEILSRTGIKCSHFGEKI